MRVADHAPNLHKLRPVASEPPLPERAGGYSQHGCDLGGRVHELGFFGGFRPHEEHIGGVGELVALRGLDVDDAPVGGGDSPADVDLRARAAGLVDHCGEDQIRGGGVGRVCGDCVGLLCHIGAAFIDVLMCVALPVRVVRQHEKS